MFSITSHEEGLGIKIKKDEVRPEAVDKYKYLTIVFKLLEGDVFTKYLNTITHLDLSSNNLTDLPVECKVLYNLTDLNLSHNKFKKIPSCFYRGLKNLKTLDLSYNPINIFMEPKCSKSLEILYLDNNRLRFLPPWIWDLRFNKLKKLRYNNNTSVFNFTNCYYNIYEIAKLEKLELRSSSLWDVHLKYLKSLVNLRSLDIGNNHLYHNSIRKNSFKNLDLIFRQFRWKDMKVLKFDHLGISYLPDGLFWVESLTEIHINNNNITCFPRESIEFLFNLEILNVSCNKLYALPDKLDELDNLKTIIAYQNCIEAIPALPNCLECLDLYDNQLQEIDTDLINRDNIKFIDLDYNYATLSKEHPSYKQYYEKRHQFRKKFNMDYNRYDDIIIVKDLPIINNDTSSLEDSDELIEIVNSTEVEEWSDTEWDCDFNSVETSSHTTIVNAGLYIDLEALLFEDAD